MQSCSSLTPVFPPIQRNQGPAGNYPSFLKHIHSRSSAADLRRLVHVFFAAASSTLSERFVNIRKHGFLHHIGFPVMQTLVPQALGQLPAAPFMQLCPAILNCPLLPELTLLRGDQPGPGRDSSNFLFMTLCFLYPLPSSIVQISGPTKSGSIRECTPWLLHFLCQEPPVHPESWLTRSALTLSSNRLL